MPGGKILGMRILLMWSASKRYSTGPNLGGSICRVEYHSHSWMWDQRVFWRCAWVVGGNVQSLRADAPSFPTLSLHCFCLHSVEDWQGWQPYSEHWQRVASISISSIDDSTLPILVKVCPWAAMMAVFLPIEYVAATVSQPLNACIDRILETVSGCLMTVAFMS